MWRAIFLFIILLMSTVNGYESRFDDVEDFEDWFREHGGRCRCDFTVSEDGEVAVVADRFIRDGEATLMVPEAILLNATVVER